MYVTFYLRCNSPNIFKSSNSAIWFRRVYLLILTFLAGLFYPMLTVAQNRGLYSTPPTTASLGKYIENPVSLYTGTPQISIPLWTINLNNGLKLPISLSYHAGGIKIEEQSSDVGLGWSLIAGGAITRIIYGTADDLGYNRNNGSINDRSLGRFYLNDPTLTTKERIPVNTVEVFDPSSNDAAYLKTTLNSMGFERLEPIYQQGGLYRDFEPDVFYLNFMGITGKFIFKVEEGVLEAKTIPYQDLKISWTLDNNGELNSFTIVDDKGNSYYFNDIERTVQYTLNHEGYIPTSADGYSDGVFEAVDRVSDAGIDDTFICNNAWYLSKIITSDGQEVDFNYANDEIGSFVNLPDHETVSPDYPSGRTSQLKTWRLGLTETTSSKRLVSISTTDQIINFPADFKRDDVDSHNLLTSIHGTQNAYAITGVNITQKSTSRLLKSYTFNYSYFQSPLLTSFGTNLWGHYNTDPGFSSYFKRLKLDKVTEAGIDGSTLPPYIFDYDTTHMLPYKLSYQQDLWGYFNGASSNTVLVPKIYVYPDLSADDRFRVYPKSSYTGTPATYLDQILVLGNTSITPAADRLPNANYITAGSLTKITYPTGGYVKYTYEPHTFIYNGDSYSGGGLRIKQIDSYITPTSSTAALTKQYVYTDSNNLTTGRAVAIPQMAALPMSTNNIVNNVARYTVSQVPLGQTSGSNIGYSQVTEFIGTSSSNIGKTVYTYDIPGMQGDLSDIYGFYTPTQIYKSPLDQVSSVGSHVFTPYNFPFPLNTDYDWNRGALISKLDYNSSGTLVKSVTNTYGFYFNQKATAPGNVYGLTVKEFYAAPAEYVNSNYVYDYYVFGKYNYLTDVAKVLLASQESVKDGVTPYTTTMNYAYNGRYQCNQTSSELINSKGESIKHNYFYPEDLMSMPISDKNTYIDMFNRHFTGKPVRESTTKDGNYVKVATDHYSEPYPNLIVPGSTELQFYDYNQPSVTTENFINYDDRGNLLEYSKYTGPHTSYLYGYDKKYVIAQINNAAVSNIYYDGFEEGSGNTRYGDAKTGHYSFSGHYVKSLTGLGNGSYIKSYWQKNNGNWSFVSTTVTVSGGSYSIDLPSSQYDDIRFYPADAQMTTFTYEPLIGMTSKTDVKGEISYYEYDVFLRLLNIKDKDGNIIKSYCYNYAGQTTGCALPIPVLKIPLTINNNTGVTYEISFLANSGNVTADFTGSLTLQVPADTYEVDIFPIGGSNASYNITVGNQSVSAPRYNFQNVFMNPNLVVSIH